jgi:hypothetical protein
MRFQPETTLPPGAALLVSVNPRFSTKIVGSEHRYYLLLLPVTLLLLLSVTLLLLLSVTLLSSVSYTALVSTAGTSALPVCGHPQAVKLRYERTNADITYSHLHDWPLSVLYAHEHDDCRSPERRSGAEA